MRFFLLILLFYIKAMGSVPLLDCAPKDGQLSPDKNFYNTFSIETDDLNEGIFKFRKGFLSHVDHSYIEKEIYKLGFFFMQDDGAFAIGYEFMEDKLLILGSFWTNEEEATALANSIIYLEFNNSVEGLKKLLLPPEEIEEWQCLVHLKNFKAFLSKEEPTELSDQINNLKKHFLSSLRVTSPGYSSVFDENRVD